MMTVKQIYDELLSHDAEWKRAFQELARLFKEATPEQREMVLKVLRERKA